MPIKRTIKLFLSVFLIFLTVNNLYSSPIDTGSASGYATAGEVGGNGSRYTITLRDTELKEALKFLATIEGLNIIVPENLTGVVNVVFNNVTVLDAINSIIKANDLDYAVERGVMRVGNTGQFTNTGEDLKTETFRLRYATAADLTDKVQSLLTDRGSVLADERTNSLVIRERPANIESVKRFLGDIDIRDAQVLIEAKIVEATRDFSRNLGIQWGINNSGNKVNVRGVEAVGTDDSDRFLNVDLPAANPSSGVGLIIGTLRGGTNIDVQLTAAEQKGDAHVISEPSIVTSNGITAKIRSGETLLIKTTGDLNIGATTATAGTGLYEVETGVELNVTPQISGGELVKLKIDAQTSQPDFSRVVEGIPVIVANTASTEVLVIDGQTTVIGGLSKFIGSDTTQKVPFLSEIPVFGNLFKSRAKSKRNTELMIFIKPVIVRAVDRVLADNSEAERVEEEKSKLIVVPDKKRSFPGNTSDSRVDNASRRNPHLIDRHRR